LNLSGQGEAAPDGKSIAQDGTGATNALSTAFLCPCQLQVLAQYLKESPVRENENVVCFTVNIEHEGYLFRHV
jgi:hypothetical protein